MITLRVRIGLAVIRWVEKDIHGMRMRIFKQIDGEVIFREFSYPDPLSATIYPWTDESL